MYTKQRLFFLLAQSPVHVGSGSDLGVVDLPIQRERHTGFPKIEASGIKGVFRDYFRQKTDRVAMDLIFGPDEGETHQSAAAFIDGRLLFFPVKSVRGIFAWITCPQCLARFQEALRMVGTAVTDEKGHIDLDALGANTITAGSAITTGKNNEAVVLEEHPVKPVKEDAFLTRFAKWFAGEVLSGQPYQQDKIKNSLLVTDDDTFGQFVQLSTEVIARTRINPDTGTVQTGALWYEEYLPTETILYSILEVCRPMKEPMPKDDSIPKDDNDVMAFISGQENWPELIQVGGNKTIGKGYMKPLLLEKK